MHYMITSMKAVARRIISILCILASATASTVSLPLKAGSIGTEDRNRDGRPDSWRIHDVSGKLAQVATDTNFDGRTDQNKYYVDDQLVRRELDRNFDEVADLVEHFDEATQEPVRSIIDVDFDGTADLLVLLQDGRPVFEESADSEPTHRPRLGNLAAPIPNRHAALSLASLIDIFRTDTAIRGESVQPATESVAGMLQAARLTVCPLKVITPVIATSSLLELGSGAIPTRPVAPSSTRGPPPALT